MIQSQVQVHGVSVSDSDGESRLFTVPGRGRRGLTGRAALSLSRAAAGQLGKLGPMPSEILVQIGLTRRRIARAARRRPLPALLAAVPLRLLST